MPKFVDQRAKFFAQMQANSIAIFPSAPEQTRSADVEYPYRQNNDFYYLTGINEPNCTAVLTKDASGECKFVVFSAKSDPESEVWTGKKLGEDGVKQHQAEWFDKEEADKKIPEFMQNKAMIYYPFDLYADFSKKLMAWRKTTAELVGKIRTQRLSETWQRVPTLVSDTTPIIAELRLFKTPEEIEVMARAAQISAEAHIALMRACKPGMMEYQLAALFSYLCQLQGAAQLAYGSIVAGGVNACILHYQNNNQALKAGDLVLIDAGCELDNYASDISRTFPVSGKFSPEQLAIYNIVLAAQEAGLAIMKPGTLWLDVMLVIDTAVVSGLVQLGILDGDVDEIVRERKFTDYYMHSYSHWLGLDCHDVGPIRVNDQDRIRRLEPGMVLTVEPGIYISPSSKCDPKWHGIGVRIEDDVLVTADGIRVLSAGVPKRPKEIEALMAKPKLVLNAFQLAVQGTPADEALAPVSGVKRLRSSDPLYLGLGSHKP